jgi:hypothetical protein
MLPHIRLSSFFYKHKNKFSKKNLFGMHEEAIVGRTRCLKEEH